MPPKDLQRTVSLPTNDPSSSRFRRPRTLGLTAGLFALTAAVLMISSMAAAQQVQSWTNPYPSYTWSWGISNNEGDYSIMYGQDISLSAGTIEVISDAKATGTVCCTNNQVYLGVTGDINSPDFVAQATSVYDVSALIVVYSSFNSYSSGGGCVGSCNFFGFGYTVTAGFQTYDVSTGNWVNGCTMAITESYTGWNANLGASCSFTDGQTYYIQAYQLFVSEAWIGFPTSGDAYVDASHTVYVENMGIDQA